MDASFHGGSNDTIDGRVRPLRPEKLLSYCQHCLIYDIGEKFISGVVDTSNKIFSPVLLIPVRNNQKA
jgi:hypothetical protein